MARMCPEVVSEHTRSQAEVDLFGIISESSPTTGWSSTPSGWPSTSASRGPRPTSSWWAPEGIFVIEVKGKRVRRENGKWILHDRGAEGTRSRRPKGPFDQAGGASAALYNYLAEAAPKVRSAIVGFGVATPDIRFAVKGPDIIPEVIYDADDVGGSFETYVARMAAYWRERLTSMKGATPKKLDERDSTGSRRADAAETSTPGPASRSRAERVDKELLRLTKEQYRVLDGLAATSEQS